MPISLVERSKKFDNEALKSDAAREAAADPVSDSTASEALDSQLRQNPVVKRKLMASLVKGKVWRKQKKNGSEHWSFLSKSASLD